MFGGGLEADQYLVLAEILVITGIFFSKIRKERILIINITFLPLCHLSK